MSCLLIRPPAPVPVREERSMPCSLAMRRTSGELWILSPLEPEEAGAGEAVTGVRPEAGAAGFGAAAGGFTGAGASAFAGAGEGAAAAEPAASMVPTTV